MPGGRPPSNPTIPPRTFHSRQEPHKYPTGSDPELDVMCWCGEAMVKVKRSLVKMSVTGECGEDCYMEGTRPYEVQKRIERRMAAAEMTRTGKK